VDVGMYVRAYPFVHVIEQSIYRDRALRVHGVIIFGSLVGGDSSCAS
jgi:hypothetical protein